MIQQQIKKDINTNFVNQIKIFRFFSKQTRDQIGNITKQERYLANENISTPESQMNEKKVYLITSGQVELHINHGNGLLTNIIKLEKGQVFGDLQFFSGENTKIYAQSKIYTSLIYVQRQDFIKILKQNQDDFELFKQIQDQFKFVGYSNIYPRKCIICQSRFHNEESCVMYDIKPSSHKIGMLAVTSEQQNHRLRYWRRKERVYAVDPFTMDELILINNKIIKKNEFYDFLLLNDKYIFEQDKKYGFTLLKQDFGYEFENEDEINLNQSQYFNKNFSINENSISNYQQKRSQSCHSISNYFKQNQSQNSIKDDDQNYNSRSPTRKNSRKSKTIMPLHSAKMLKDNFTKKKNHNKRQSQIIQEIKRQQQLDELQGNNKSLSTLDIKLRNLDFDKMIREEEYHEEEQKSYNLSDDNENISSIFNKQIHNYQDDKVISMTNLKNLNTFNNSSDGSLGIINQNINDNNQNNNNKFIQKNEMKDSQKMEDQCQNSMNKYHNLYQEDNFQNINKNSSDEQENIQKSPPTYIKSSLKFKNQNVKQGQRKNTISFQQIKQNDQNQEFSKQSLTLTNLPQLQKLQSTNNKNKVLKVEQVQLTVEDQNSMEFKKSFPNLAIQNNSKKNSLSIPNKILMENSKQSVIKDSLKKIKNPTFKSGYALRFDMINYYQQQEQKNINMEIQDNNYQDLQEEDFNYFRTQIQDELFFQIDQQISYKNYYPQFNMSHLINIYENKRYQKMIRNYPQIAFKPPTVLLNKDNQN